MVLSAQFYGIGIYRIDADNSICNVHFFNNMCKAVISLVCELTLLHKKTRIGIFSHPCITKSMICVLQDSYTYMIICFSAPVLSQLNICLE